MRRRRKRKQSLGDVDPLVVARPLNDLDVGGHVFDPKKHSVLLTLTAVGALVTFHRMARHHREGQSPMESIEGVVTGMILYGVMESVRGVARINPAPFQPNV